MITTITTAIVYVSLQLAWPMCRARQNAVMAESNIAYRFWNSVGAVGEALELAVDRFAARRGIDVSAIMLS
jgi:hypothetical protein